MKRYGEHRIPGRLFIVEGIDGSGKSTQLMLLHQWLKAEGYGVVFSEWNSSPLVKDTTKRGKKKLRESLTRLEMGYGNNWGRQETSSAV